MNEGRPALKQFLRAYLHEDWDIVYGNVWGALDSYLRSAEDGGRSLAAEIRRLLEDSDDAGLKEVLRSHHCAYSTRRYPGGDREWLREVARRAEAMMVTSSTCTIPTPHRNEVRPMHGDLLQDLDHLSPELWSFLGGYLHQDWYLDYEEWTDAFDDFSTGADLTTLVAEIDDLLAMYACDEALADRLISLGMAFRPKGGDGTCRGWLTELRERAQQALARGDAG